MVTQEKLLRGTRYDGFKGKDRDIQPAELETPRSIPKKPHEHCKYSEQKEVAVETLKPMENLQLPQDFM